MSDIRAVQDRQKSTSAVGLGDLRDLVQSMGEWRRAPDKVAHLIIVALADVLPQAKRTPDLLKEVTESMITVAAKRGGRAFRVSPSDFGILVQVAHHVLVTMVRDLKVEILRAIERQSPGSFGSIDQSRLIVSYDLSTAYRSGAERVARYAALEQQAAAGGAAKLRPLSEDDCKTVMHAYRQIGAEKFISAFVRTQSVAQNMPERGLEPVMNEYFISIDSLRKPLFIDVELRGTGRMFDEFTLVLDQIMLRAFKKIETRGDRWSLNMNVESVFTKAFEQFLEETPHETLAQITFEFRQPNIVENFDEFLVARGLIHSRGAKIAVDRIFPHTLGLVDLEYIGASIAKVHWRAGAEDVLKERKRALAYMATCGVQPVLIRVDNALALEVGADHGITMFQGFLIDDMIKRKAA
ncbi:MAG: EAL domain-containing protein [Rhodospirillaceae bacterium]|nr:MAG: EAL domain-containing protein [Rhodospirillaceae bacterium]